MQVPSIPQEGKLEYSRAQIGAEVARIGSEVAVWAAEVAARGSDLLVIPILRGGIIFFADLVRQVKVSVEIAPARAWAYSTDQFATQRDKISVAVEGVPAQGRSLLIVDDICDSGRTLKVMTESLLKKGAREVRSAVVIKRVLEEHSFKPDWVAFNYKGPEWFVGYGMEDREKWSNLPEIYTIKPHE